MAASEKEQAETQLQLDLAEKESTFTGSVPRFRPRSTIDWTRGEPGEPANGADHPPSAFVHPLAERFGVVQVSASISTVGGLTS